MSHDMADFLLDDLRERTEQLEKLPAPLAQIEHERAFAH